MKQHERVRAVHRSLITDHRSLITSRQRPPSSDRCPPWLTVAERTRPTSQKRRRFAFSPHSSLVTRHAAFTLLELLLVMAIIAIVLAFLIPSIGTGTGRSAEAAARQLAADLDGARLMAIAERTRTRVIFPTNASNFTNASSTPAPYPNDIAYRGYLIVSEKRTGEAFWRQRGKWNRFPTGTGFASLPSPTPSPNPTAMPIDATGTGSSTSYNFNAGAGFGSYIEFLANGSSNLDPAATVTPAPVIADGFVDSNGIFKQKNKNLYYTITVDPLTGAVSLQGK